MFFLSLNLDVTWVFLTKFYENRLSYLKAMIFYFINEGFFCFIFKLDGLASYRMIEKSVFGFHLYPKFNQITYLWLLRNLLSAGFLFQIEIGTRLESDFLDDILCWVQGNMGKRGERSRSGMNNAKVIWVAYCAL